MNVFVLLTTKADILKMWETEQFWIIVFFFPTMEVNGAPKQPGYKLMLQISCVQQNKEIHTGLELLEGE